MLKTIRGKFILTSILIIITLNLILSIFIYKTIINNLENNIIKTMSNMKFMAQNTAMLQIDLSKDNIAVNTKPIVDNLFSYYDNYVSLTLPTNQMFARGYIINQSTIDNILKESENKKSLLKLTKVNNRYLVTYNYPICAAKSYLGNLVIQKDYTSEYKESYNIIINIITIQVILTLFIIIALWMVINKITAPINKLSNSMMLFAKGSIIDDLRVKGKDEISILTHSFNNMKNQINTQMDALTLEQKKSTEFFNNATHEIKTPITAISGYSQLLLEEDIVNMDEEFRERALIRLVKESEKLNKLVVNILDISRGTTITSNSLETFDLGYLLKSKIDDMQIRLSKSKLTISSTLESVQVNLIKEDISTIITNLIDNAIKYSADSNINIGLSILETTTELTISNKIFSLPENIKDRLFEPFIKYTCDEVLQKQGITSSGLGLYLCSELAKKNNIVLNYTIDEDIITFMLVVNNL